MWSMLSRADDLVELVKNTTSLKELKSLKEFLSKEENTQLLRDSHVYSALKEIDLKINTLSLEDKIKGLIDIIF